MTSYLTALTDAETGATTTAVMKRFNQAFIAHDPALLDDLVGEDCVMVSVQPAPAGQRVEGREDCLAFWRTLAADRTTRFRPEEVVVAGDRATITWQYTFGPGPTDHVHGVNLMRLDGGLIVEALGYSKTGGEVPLATDADTGAGTRAGTRGDGDPVDDAHGAVSSSSNGV
ncbi:nuclear transport factor 2 family protein [Streptomyces sp. NPDC053431]|uniref:nuclear transport factor 2 family protein n=1 Tax=Streptomyces sp. NPDC053431 TaxID=3365703 RepID=UPI0037D754DF